MTTVASGRWTYALLLVATAIAMNPRLATRAVVSRRGGPGGDTLLDGRQGTGGQLPVGFDEWEALLRGECRDERLGRLGEGFHAAALVIPARQRAAEPCRPDAGSPLAAHFDRLLDVPDDGRVRTQARLQQPHFGDADVLVGDRQIGILHERQTQRLPQSDHAGGILRRRPDLVGLSIPGDGGGTNACGQQKTDHEGDDKIVM